MRLTFNIQNLSWLAGFVVALVLFHLFRMEASFGSSLLAAILVGLAAVARIWYAVPEKRIPITRRGIAFTCGGLVAVFFAIVFVRSGDSVWYSLLLALIFGIMVAKWVAGDKYALFRPYLDKGAP